MGNSFEKMGGSFEPTPTSGSREAMEDAADKEARRGRLGGLQSRRADLEAWARSWTPADRSLADRLDADILRLKKELGE